MNEEEKCPEVQKIPQLVKLDQQIPQEFLEHARQCQVCLFWLSHVLAIEKAWLTTNRLVIEDGSCPELREFFLTLLSVVRTLRTLPLAIDKKIAKNFAHLTLGTKEFFDVTDLFLHKGICQLCADYYDALWDRMIELQKSYEEAIKSGAEVRPAIQDQAEERFVSRETARKLSCPTTKKPN